MTIKRLAEPIETTGVVAFPAPVDFDLNDTEVGGVECLRVTSQSGGMSNGTQMQVVRLMLLVMLHVL